MSVQGEVTVWAVIPFMGMVFRYIKILAEENQRFIPLALLPYIARLRLLL